MPDQILRMDPGSQATDTFVHIALTELKLRIARIDELLDLLPDSKLSRRTTKPCDWGLYILGHLTSRLDILLERLSISRQRFHELEDMFIPGCDPDAIHQLTPATLRASWSIISKISMFELSQIPLTDWLEIPPDNKRITKFELPRHSRIGILLSFSHDVAYYAGRLARLD